VADVCACSGTARRACIAAGLSGDHDDGHLDAIPVRAAYLVAYFSELTLFSRFLSCRSGRLRLGRKLEISIHCYAIAATLTGSAASAKMIACTE